MIAMRMDWFGALGAALEFSCSSLARYCRCLFVRLFMDRWC